MSAQPKKATGMKAKLAEIAAKSDAAKSIRSVIDIDTEKDRSAAAPSSKNAGTPKTLPKVTLYAHAEVLTAIRILAAKDGVQAQEILRRAVKAYLTERGEPFTDLTTGERP